MSKFAILPDGQMVDRSRVTTVQKVTMDNGEVNIVLQIENFDPIFVVCDNYADQEKKLSEIQKELTKFNVAEDSSLN